MTAVSLLVIAAHLHKSEFCHIASFHQLAYIRHKQWFGGDTVVYWKCCGFSHFQKCVLHFPPSVLCHLITGVCLTRQHSCFPWKLPKQQEIKLALCAKHLDFSFQNNNFTDIFNENQQGQRDKAPPRDPSEPTHSNHLISRVWGGLWLNQCLPNISASP